VSPKLNIDNVFQEKTMRPYARYAMPRRIPVRGVKNGIIQERRVEDQQAIEYPDVQANGVLSTQDEIATSAENTTDWQAMALRLQAEMDNFRRRQQRRTNEATAAEQKRLLRLILPVADNLARALDHEDQDDAVLRQGVELIYRELTRLLEAEGVTRLEIVGQPFRPSLHEAIATAPADVEPNTIIEEVEAGYRIGDELLRPARVVVAA
jgi:molecular chaperone GrpE